MKKGIALVTVIVMLLAIFSGCASSAKDEDTSQTSQATQVSATEESAEEEATESESEASAEETIAAPEPFTIGFPLITTTTDPTTLSYLNCFTSVVEACGGTPILIDWDWTPDGLVTCVQTLISMEVDGICIINMTDSNLPTLGKMCEEAGIPFVIENVMHDEIAEIMNGFEMFVGNSITNDESDAYDATVKLYELGARNIVVTGNPVGDMTGENRDAGVYAAAEELGMTILAEPRGMTSAEEVTKFMESAVAAYPELDGVLIETSATSDMLPSIIKVLEDHNLDQEVIVGKFDDDTTMVDYFEAGQLSFVYGLHIAPMIYFQTILLCNTVLGTPLSEDPVYFTTRLSVIEDAEQARNALLYMANPDVPIYTAEETRQLIQYYNPDFTLETFLETVAGYGIEDVMTRHEGLVD